MTLNLNKTGEDGRNPACGSGGGAEYLAAILPELAQIAKTAHLYELSEQIDLAAILAQKTLVHPDSLKRSLG
jgi:hypothetical protein